MTTTRQNVSMILLAVELFFCMLDQLFDRRPVPAGPEIGCDDDGSWCDGTDSGETCFAYLSPLSVVDLSGLEEAASRSLGPIDFSVLGRRSDGSPVLARRS